MSFIDQGAGRPAIEAVPMRAVYKRTSRGFVCKTVEDTDPFTPPAGWSASHAELGWNDDPILVANLDDEAEEAPAPKRSKKASE